MSSNNFRSLLENCDVEGLRNIWKNIFPHMPQPENYEQAEIVMHHARTTAESMSFRARAYSHRWLTERDIPSGLPDKMKPKAERLYPVIADVVGISLNTNSEYLRPALIEVRKSMEDAVLDSYADGNKDPIHIQNRMNEARKKTMRALFGDTHGNHKS